MSTLTHSHTTDRGRRRSLHLVHPNAAHRVALFRIFFGAIWAVDAVSSGSPASSKTSTPT